MSELNNATQEMIDKYGKPADEVGEFLKERYNPDMLKKAHETNYSELELPKTLTEKQRITDLVKETMDSLKGKSCYEPEILEAVKAVMYKEKEPVSKNDFASALVSKLKEEGIVKHEGELSSIQKGVESALSRINEKRKVVSSKPE